jgi:hypothetical protein
MLADGPSAGGTQRACTQADLALDAWILADTTVMTYQPALTLLLMYAWPATPYDTIQQLIASIFI